MRWAVAIHEIDPTRSSSSASSAMIAVSAKRKLNSRIPRSPTEECPNLSKNMSRFDVRNHHGLEECIRWQAAPAPGQNFCRGLQSTAVYECTQRLTLSLSLRIHGMWGFQGRSRESLHFFRATNMAAFVVLLADSLATSG